MQRAQSTGARVEDRKSVLRHAAGNLPSA
jgi:hypothetical protein